MIPRWDNRVADIVSKEIWGKSGLFDTYQALGSFAKSGALLGGLVFHNWDERAGLIEASAAARDRRWMSRAVINEAMSYVFDRVECQMLMARQSHANKPARHAWTALGGTEIIIPRLYGRNEDGTIITLTQEQWQSSKFRRPDHGQE